MGKVVADITMSLDGFITGPDDRPGRGLGERGEPLHNWVMGGPTPSAGWMISTNRPRTAAPSFPDQLLLP